VLIELTSEKCEVSLNGLGLTIDLSLEEAEVEDGLDREARLKVRMKVRIMM
jgi:hypothetical protein